MYSVVKIREKVRVPPKLLGENVLVNDDVVILGSMKIGERSLFKGG